MFVIVTVAEALLAVLIIMGLWVRMSALVMSLGILLMFADSEPESRNSRGSGATYS